MRNKLLGRAWLLTGMCGLAGVLGTLPGCVIAVDTEPDIYAYESTPTRVKLTPAERDSLPVITSIADLPTIRTRYADQLATLGPTTTVEQFQSTFPQARFVERTNKANAQGVTETVDAYSVTLKERFRKRNENYGVEARDEMWFYFKNGVLVKRAGPRDWPN